MSKEPKVCAIIVTYNGIEWIEKCLRSIIKSTITVDIIVVDNGSEDGTLTFVKSNFPSIHLIESPVNLGFGEANNRGLRYCLGIGYDFYFLLNQDAWVQESTIKRLTKYQSSSPEFGIISPVHLNGSGTSFDRNFAFFVREELNPGLLEICKQELAVEKLEPVLFVNAAAWSISDKCLRKVGKFHPAFFHYGEDDNYVSRVRRSGFMIGILTSAFIYHDREDRPPSKLFESFKRKTKRELTIFVLDPFRNVVFRDLFNYGYSRLRTNLGNTPYYQRPFLFIWGIMCILRVHRLGETCSKDSPW